MALTAASKTAMVTPSIQAKYHIIFPPNISGDPEAYEHYPNAAAK
jgi:hypothetical protein